jgi:hypothetical protein
VLDFLMKLVAASHEKKMSFLDNGIRSIVSLLILVSI